MPVITPGNTQAERRAIVARDTYNTKLDRIRADFTLSDEGKRAQIARAYLDVTKSVEALRASEGNTTDTRRRTLETKILGGLGSDPAAAISFRDASDRAEKVSNEDEAVRLLKRAALSSDVAMEKALLSVAYTKRWPEIIEQYGEHHPEQYGEADELWRLTDSTHRRANQLAASMSYDISRPSELGGLSDLVLEDVADGRQVTEDIFGRIQTR